jgi:hypothetical protein
MANENTFLDIPKSYNKLEPPESLDEKTKMVNIFTQIILEDIDFIDIHGMKIGLTLKISMKWTDARLKFKSIRSEGTKYLLDDETSSLLWLPLNHVNHVGAVIGEIRQDSKRMIAASSSNHSWIIAPNEIKYSHDGNRILLQMTQRFKIHYKCHFNVRKYPFDQHKCEIGMKMMEGQETINIKQDLPVLSGRELLTGKWEVREYNVETVETKKTKYYNQEHSISIHNSGSPINSTQETFTIIIGVKRDPKDQLLTMFGPTILFWLLAYLTLYFDIDDINNRSRTSVTVLLVVVSLWSSLKNDFPKTTYFKFVDLWFFWFVVNIFIIISVHIILETVDLPISFDPNKLRILTKGFSSNPMMVQPARRGESAKRSHAKNSVGEGTQTPTMESDGIKKGWLSMERINTFLKVLLPLLTTTFIVLYYKFTVEEA